LTAFAVESDLLLFVPSLTTFARGSDLLLFVPLPALLFAALPKEVGNDVGDFVGWKI
jgi:hypothetical protein